MQSQEAVLVKSNGRTLATSQFMIKPAGEHIAKDFFEIGSRYAIPVASKHGIVECVHFTYIGREIPETDLKAATGKFIFEGIYQVMRREFTEGELQMREIEKLPLQTANVSDGPSILAQNKNVKYDGDEIPKDFFVIGKKYDVSSSRHADDKRDAYRTKKYVFLGRNDQLGIYAGGYIFGLPHALNKNIIYSVAEMKDMRVERIVEDVEAEIAPKPTLEAATSTVVEGIEPVATASNEEKISMPDNGNTDIQSTTNEGASNSGVVRIFRPNRRLFDMDAIFDGTVEFYARVREFLQPDKADKTYALVDSLKGKITNKAVLLLFTLSGTGDDAPRRNNLSRKLDMSGKEGVVSYVREQLAFIASMVDVIEGTPHHDIFNYYCDFMKIDKSEIIAEAEKLKKQADTATLEVSPIINPETEINKLIDAVLATMTVEARAQRLNRLALQKDRNIYAEDYNHYGALLRMASHVLSPEEFSVLSFYMRPMQMHPPQDPTRWVKLPSAIDAYRSDKTPEQRREMAYLAAIKVKLSDEYKKFTRDRGQSGNSDKREACALLRGIIKDISERVSPNIFSLGAQMEREGKASLITGKATPPIPPKEGKEITNPTSQTVVKEVDTILGDILATIPVKNHGIKEANRIAATILNAEEYSVLAFYLRPSHMIAAPRGEGKPDKRVPLPQSALKHHEGKEIPQKIALSFLALQKVLGSSVYQEAKASQNDDQLTAIRVLDSLLDYLTKKVKKSELEKITKRDGAATTPPNDRPVRKANASTPAAEDAVVPKASVAASSPIPAFNKAVADVVAEEQKYITPYSVKGALLGFFSEVVGVSPVVLTILSKTLLRKETVGAEVAVKSLTDMGLSFEDAATMVSGAVAKIRQKATGNPDYDFVIDALEKYKFE